MKLNKDQQNPISSVDVLNFTTNSPAHLIHDKILHTYHEENKEQLFNTVNDDMKHNLPSILNYIVPTILLRPCRQIPENRINNADFIISFRRSHRIPLFDEHKTLYCTCKKNWIFLGIISLHVRNTAR